MVTYQNTYSIAAGNNANALGGSAALSVGGHTKTIAGLVQLSGVAEPATVTLTVNGFVLPTFNLAAAPASGMPFVLPIVSGGYGDIGITVSYTVTGTKGNFVLTLMV